MPENNTGNNEERKPKVTINSWEQGTVTVKYFSAVRQAKMDEVKYLDIFRIKITDSMLLLTDIDGHSYGIQLDTIVDWYTDSKIFVEV